MTAAIALSLCALAHPAPAASADPVFLACTFDNGRSILGLVVFRQLKKLRIWYGDGGGQEWDGVDFAQGNVTTSVQDGRSMTLSGDLTRATFNDQEGNEHGNGRCQIASTSGKPARWFEPRLRQPWE